MGPRELPQTVLLSSSFTQSAILLTTNQFFKELGSYKKEDGEGHGINSHRVPALFSGANTLSLRPGATQTELTSDPMDSKESKARDGVMAILGCQLNYI